MSEPVGPATVLVVDDVPDNIEVVAGILSGSYQVKAAISGERALKIINSDKPPDLILLDIMMPEMDGFHVCRRIKENPRTRHIPVIFLSAMNTDKDIVHGLELGAVDYVTKPPMPAVLLARVATHVRLSREKQLVLENAVLREDVERITRHDLKNPLGIILGYASMLSEDPTIESEHRESARFMEIAAYEMMDLINNSLNLYKIEKGTYQCEPQPIPLADIVIAPRKARRIFRGVSPRRERVSHPPVSSLGPVAECGVTNKA
ncbi:MAG: response regulator, partial [Gammaproteobacteria bacterium]|nr:response regulator [Gammaproteobacteria bacterium]